VVLLSRRRGMMVTDTRLQEGRRGREGGRERREGGGVSKLIWSSTRHS